MKLKKLLWLNEVLYFESKDIKNLSFDIRIDNSLKKKQLFEFEHNNIIYKIIIGGRIDGYVNETTILETKHRRDRLFNLYQNMKWYKWKCIFIFLI